MFYEDGFSINVMQKVNPKLFFGGFVNLNPYFGHIRNSKSSVFFFPKLTLFFGEFLTAFRPLAELKDKWTFEKSSFSLDEGAKK
jgi:hypothetical protein